MALVPQPTKAVVLLFPDSPEAHAARREEDAKIAALGSQPHLDPTIFYVKQKVCVLTSYHSALLKSTQISNACGTIALIHALANVGMPSAFHPFHPFTPNGSFS